jgi:ketosteroid isomerase-like protein
MSAENVEIVRQVHEAWARGDFSSTNLFDPEIEFETIEGVGHGIYHGVEEMTRAWREIVKAYDSFRTDVEEILDAGDKVVVLTVPAMRFKGGATELTQRTAVVWTLCGGKAVRLALYSDRQAALREAGTRSIAPVTLCSNPGYQEPDRQQAEGGAGEVFGAFARTFTDARAEAHPDLGEREGLHGYQDDHREYRKPQQSEREADRQLVEADADTERDRGGDATPLLARNAQQLVVGQQEVGREHSKHADRDVIGRTPDRVSERAAGRQADERHPALEQREPDRCPQALTGRGSGDPQRRGDGERVQAERDDERENLERHRPTSVEVVVSDERQELDELV